MYDLSIFVLFILTWSKIMHDTIKTLTEPATAFQLFDRVPEGCSLFTVPDNRHWPHLREAEWALIDEMDREIEWNEVYLVQNLTKPSLWQIIGFPDDDEAAFLALLNRPRSSDQLDQWVADGKPLHMSDGPFSIDRLRELIIGKVMGIFQAVDTPLRITAGA